MSARPKRERKVSAKIAFLDSHSSQWEEHKAELDATKNERKRKRLENKRAREAETKKRKRKTGKKTAAPKKKGRSSGGPKKPLSAYMFFAKDTRAEVKEEFPNATFGEVAQILGEWWQDCTASERKKYEKLAKQDKARYVRECGGKASSTSRKKTTSKKKPSSTASSGKLSYYGMAKNAIMALKNRKGSSQIAIERYILETYMDESTFQRHHLRKALKTNSDNGKLIKNKASFKVSAAEKRKR